MQCPKCGQEMEHGFIAADQWFVNVFTRLEWYGHKPRVMAYSGDPLSRFGHPAAVPADRCRTCRKVVFEYETERWL